MAACAAWSWRRSDGLCWLKDATHGTAADPHLDSGAKLCGAAAPAEPAGAAPAASAAHERLEQDVVLQESADGGRTWGPVRVVSRTVGSRDP